MGDDQINFSPDLFLTITPQNPRIGIWIGQPLDVKELVLHLR